MERGNIQNPKQCVLMRCHGETRTTCISLQQPRQHSQHRPATGSSFIALHTNNAPWSSANASPHPPASFATPHLLFLHHPTSDNHKWAPFQLWHSIPIWQNVCGSVHSWCRGQTQGEWLGPCAGQPTIPNCNFSAPTHTTPSAGDVATRALTDTPANVTMAPGKSLDRHTPASQLLNHANNHRNAFRAFCPRCRAKPAPACVMAVPRGQTCHLQQRHFRHLWGLPPPPPQGLFACLNPAPSESGCSGRCIAGWVGMPHAFCRNGTWDLRGTGCTPQCFGQPTIANGTFPTTCKYSTCKGQCLPNGFQGSPLATCINGNWIVFGNCTLKATNATSTRFAGPATSSLRLVLLLWRPLQKPPPPPLLTTSAQWLLHLHLPMLPLLRPQPMMCLQPQLMIPLLSPLLTMSVSLLALRVVCSHRETNVTQRPVVCEC